MYEGGPGTSVRGRGGGRSFAKSLWSMFTFFFRSGGDLKGVSEKNLGLCVTFSRFILRVSSSVNWEILCFTAPPQVQVFFGMLAGADRNTTLNY